jgi:prophage regulatory protein
METSRREHPPKTIIRLAEVRRRTGYSRSTIYLLIAKKEFPHQVPLGERSVGWIEEEIDAWIAERASRRPVSDTQPWMQYRVPREETSLEEASMNAPYVTPALKMPLGNPEALKESKLRRDQAVPDLARLELIGTNVYVDKATGTLWFQVLTSKHRAD